MSMNAMQKRFSEEFKIEAVRQTTERGYVLTHQNLHRSGG